MSAIEIAKTNLILSLFKYNLYYTSRINSFKERLIKILVVLLITMAFNINFNESVYSNDSSNLLLICSSCLFMISLIYISSDLISYNSYIILI